jgi:hypothetical protein
VEDEEEEEGNEVGKNGKEMGKNEERWGRLKARREQWGGHLIFVGEQLPAKIFNLPLFRHIRLVA